MCCSFSMLKRTRDDTAMVMAFSGFGWKTRANEENDPDWSVKYFINIHINKDPTVEHIHKDEFCFAFIPTPTGLLSTYKSKG